jgi:hypothetical protein
VFYDFESATDSCQDRTAAPISIYRAFACPSYRDWFPNKTPPRRQPAWPSTTYDESFAAREGVPAPRPYDFRDYEERGVVLLEARESRTADYLPYYA